MLVHDYETTTLQPTVISNSTTTVEITEYERIVTVAISHHGTHGYIVHGPRPEHGDYWLCGCEDTNEDHSHCMESSECFPASWVTDNCE